MYPPSLSLSLARQLASLSHHPTSAYSPLVRRRLVDEKNIESCTQNNAGSIILNYPFLSSPLATKLHRGRGSGAQPDALPLYNGIVPAANGFGDYQVGNGMIPGVLRTPNLTLEVASVGWSPRWHTFGDWRRVEASLAHASDTEKAVYQPSIRTDEDRTDFAKKDTYLLLLSPQTAETLTPTEISTLIFTHTVELNDPLMSLPLSQHAYIQSALSHVSSDATLRSTHVASLIASAASANNPTINNSVIAIRLS